MNPESIKMPPAADSNPSFTQQLQPPPCQRWDACLFALPVATALTLLGIYLVSPSFYSTYVLEYRSREAQAVEILTVVLALVAGLALYVASIWLWGSMRGRPGVGRWPGGALIIFIAATAAFFFGGEEMNWGQTYLGYKAPETFKETMDSNSFNLHNIKGLASPVHTLANVYLLGMYVALPVAWALRQRLNLSLPADWVPAIPRWPVAWCMVFASVWKSVKDVYRILHTETQRQTSPFYVDFLEQINEQREFLVAMALAIYAVNCLAYARRSAAIARSLDLSGR